MPRVLVVANLTLGDSDFLQAIRDRMDKGPCGFTLLVPATPRSDRESTMQMMGRPARERDCRVPMTRALTVKPTTITLSGEWSSALTTEKAGSHEVDGQVGDANPLKAIESLLPAEIRRDHLVQSAQGRFSLAEAGSALQGDPQVFGSRHARQGVAITRRGRPLTKWPDRELTTPCAAEEAQSPRKLDRITKVPRSSFLRHP